MPASDSPAILVARFLRSNNYTETLNIFLSEAGLPADAGTVGGRDDSLTIEKILEEKKTFDLSLQFEKLGTDGNETKRWSIHAPTLPSQVRTLPSNSNILSVSFDLNCSRLVSTTADRRLNMHSLLSNRATPDQLSTSSLIYESPILSCATLTDSLMVITSMSGQIALIDSRQFAIISKRRDHLKYVVQVAVHITDGSHAWMATAGWDSTVYIYRISLSGTTPLLPEPSATIKLPTNPESLVFLEHPETSEPVLILTRRDSTFLYYHSVKDSALIGKQNLAPHSNAWIAFTPSAIALCPTDSSLLAVATSAVPHMKLLVVRLMVPPMTSEVSASITPVERAVQAPPSLRTSLLDADNDRHSAAAMNREAVALQEREGAAILVQVSTLAPQTPYSTPALAWRPDGSGVWVNSDDGVIRGIEASTGKIVSTLGGHEPGSKIRCLCAGRVETEDGTMQERLVSGGFDQRLIVWSPENE